MYNLDQPVSCFVNFRQISALKLDRDIRAVVSYITSLTSQSIRDKFTRLKQVTFLINVDTISEAVDTVTALHPSQKISANDLRSILKLRSDFNRTEIRRIKF